MKPYFIEIASALLLAALAGLSSWYVMHTREIALRALVADLQSKLQTATADSARALSELSAQLDAEKQAASKTISDLTQNLTTLTKDRDELKESLEEEQDKYRKLEKQVGSALKTVGDLDKLSKIDPELLQKYSKVYFLNEHYAPPKILPIEKEYLYNESDLEYLHAQAMPFFEEMVHDAKDDGVDLYVVSAFRSFNEQKSLKSAYTVTYGSGANTFSADQGYSEHQLGTTVDFTTKGINGGLAGFDTTPAFEWLQENAHRYGFVLSYPKGNAYYIYEPWHWRFVGEDLARKLHKNDQYFYDLDQREIDKYLISLFD